MPRRTTLALVSGPYTVKSCADGTLVVTPAWPQFPKWTEEDGGGPGWATRLTLAADLERWLNAPYRERE